MCAPREGASRAIARHELGIAAATAWSASTLSKLHESLNETDAQAADFWEQVATRVGEGHSAEECSEHFYRREAPDGAPETRLRQVPKCKRGAAAPLEEETFFFQASPWREAETSAAGGGGSAREGGRGGRQRRGVTPRDK